MRSYSAADIRNRAATTGDIIIEKSGGGEKQPVGRVGLLIDQTLVVPTNFAGRLRPAPDQDARYLTYVLASLYFAGRTRAVIKQTTGIQNLDVEELLATRVPLLQRDEQRAIADYLDVETTRIASLISKKRRMVLVLNERRVTTIERAVTRGLDPAANIRASNVELLDQIPSHWDVTPLAMLCDFQPGKAHEPFVDQEGQYICVNSRFISTSGRTVKHCTANLSPVQKSDILMVMSDLPNGRALAKAFFVDDDRPYAVNQRVCRISPRAIHPRYAFYQLDRNPRFLMHDDGSNQTHLANSVFAKFSLLVPPASEQVAIADFLDEKTSAFAAASRSLAHQIALLKEQREALITAAVTGELEIPGVAA